jgi:hypothetical protein
MKIKKVYNNIKTERQDRKKRKPEIYKEFSQFSIGSKSSGLALISRRVNSEINFPLHLSTVGFMFLKIQSFLVVQILQAIRMVISMKKGTCNLRLILLKMRITEVEVDTVTPMDAQQALAKLHRKKRWALVSGLCKIHRSQV